MELEGFGLGGSFGGLEFGVSSASLNFHGVDGGLLGAVVLGNGSIVNGDGLAPCGVPLSLDPDLLGRGVPGAEVDVSCGVSVFGKCHALGLVLGASSLGFREG